jgi:hypothetical protein
MAIVMVGWRNFYGTTFLHLSYASSLMSTMIFPCRTDDGGSRRPFEDMGAISVPLETNGVEEKVESAPKRAKSGFKTK